jgi:molybdenum cofactor cytidylyltransferase
VIAAIVLAAGKSERMGRPKMALPWGDTTVLGAVLRALASAGIEDIRVVTGAARDLVEPLCVEPGVTTVFNAAYGQADMLSSIQTGLKSLSAMTEAALVVLGDQPQIQVETIHRVVEAYRRSRPRLVAPSHRMRRGHPWLVDRQMWPELLKMTPNDTAREFLARHDGEIKYVEIESATIHKDVDTPDEYLNSRP